MANFKERYLAGEIEFEEIDDYVDEWNNSDDTRTLAQFLGLNEEEEDVWIDEGDDALYELLEQQKEDWNCRERKNGTKNTRRRKQCYTLTVTTWKAHILQSYSA